MAESGAFYIASTAGGKCLSYIGGGKPIADCRFTGTKAQQWVIEYGDEENKLAFKNVQEGKYLAALDPIAAKVCWGRVGLAEEKQWWLMEKGKAPGSCLLKSLAYPSSATPSYLNDFNGQYVDKNYVHMWQMVVSRKCRRKRVDLADSISIGICRVVAYLVACRRQRFRLQPEGQGW